MSSKIRLQVFLSHNGVCSRREAMTVVQSGRVRLNGVIEKEPSRPVDPSTDRVEVDGKVILGQSVQYVMLNKPAGCVTTREDPHAQRTVLDLLPPELRHLHPVGRLDRDTEGLLLLTNDGDVAYFLTHPSFNVFKTYQVRVQGTLEKEQVRTLERGLLIDGKKTAPAQVKEVRVEGTSTDFLMTIHEGRKRQIRLMLKAVGHPVLTLTRMTQGPLHLGALKTGQFRVLSSEEVSLLKNLAGDALRDSPGSITRHK